MLAGAPGCAHAQPGQPRHWLQRLQRLRGSAPRRAALTAQRALWLRQAERTNSATQPVDGLGGRRDCVLSTPAQTRKPCHEKALQVRGPQAECPQHHSVGHQPASPARQAWRALPRRPPGRMQLESAASSQPPQRTSGVGSMPVLTTSAPMSPRTAAIWRRMKSVGATCTACTPCVFCRGGQEDKAARAVRGARWRAVRGGCVHLCRQCRQQPQTACPASIDASPARSAR